MITNVPVINIVSITQVLVAICVSAAMTDGGILKSHIVVNKII